MKPYLEADTLRRALEHAESLRNILEYLQRQVPEAYQDGGQLREVIAGLRARLADLGNPPPSSISCTRRPAR